MTKQTKTNKPSTKPKRIKKTVKPTGTYDELCEYYDFMFAGGKSTEPFISTLCNQLVKWAIANKGIAIRVNEFCDDYKMPRYVLDIYASRWPKLDQAKKEAKAILGDCNYKGAVIGKLNWPAVRHILYQFHDDFKDAEEFHAELKAKVAEKQSAGTINVIKPTLEDLVAMQKYNDEKV